MRAPEYTSAPKNVADKNRCGVILGKICEQSNKKVARYVSVNIRPVHAENMQESRRRKCRKWDMKYKKRAENVTDGTRNNRRRKNNNAKKTQNEKNNRNSARGRKLASS